jgi:2-(1,2-epoxy-1,2-dihydrophenyl)acetyl-CoA isomerase
LTQSVIYETADGVATIMLNRPQKLNAFDATTLQDIKRALEAAKRDDMVRVVVLTGTGRAFSSGQDLTAGLPKDGDGQIDLAVALERDYAPLVMQLMNYPKVTVAALNGLAVGAAANIALACDIAIAARSAYLQQVFVRIGLIPDVGGTWLLPRIVGAKLALALALTGDRVSADDAKAMGLVYRVFDDAEFASGLRDFVKVFAHGPATAYRLIKESLRKSQANDLERQLQLEAVLQGEAGRSKEFDEARRAFAEKRPPEFGRK